MRRAILTTAVNERGNREVDGLLQPVIEVMAEAAAVGSPIRQKVFQTADEKKSVDAGRLRLLRMQFSQPCRSPLQSWPGDAKRGMHSAQHIGTATLI